MALLAAFLAMLLLWAIPASAQDKAALPLVAMLRVNSANTIEPMATMFRTALATHGHIDGCNIRLESRLAEGRIEQLPTLAQSLARDRASDCYVRRGRNARGAGGDENNSDRCAGR